MNIAASSLKQIGGVSSNNFGENGFTASAIRIRKLIELRRCVFHVAQGLPSVLPVGHHFDLLTPKTNADQERNEGEVPEEAAP